MFGVADSTVPNVKMMIGVAVAADTVVDLSASANIDIKMLCMGMVYGLAAALSPNGMIYAVKMAENTDWMNQSTDQMCVS